MAQLLLPAVLLLSVILVQQCSATNVTNLYYVRPTDSDSDVNCSCSVAAGQQLPCLTLSEYTDETERYFEDNTTFMFLPGSHLLDVCLDLVSLSNVTLTSCEGEQNTSIVLVSTFARINCIDCDSVVISGLGFVFNHSSWRSQFNSKGIVLSRSSDCLLSNLHFTRTYSIIWLNVVYVEDSDNIRISNIHISDFTTELSAFVGLRSTIDFYGHNSFVNTAGRAGGGAIYLSDCITNFYGGIAMTTDNLTTSEGEALYTNSNSSSLHGSNTFTNNRARLGGVLYIVDSTVNFFGNNLFMNNRARANGGALYTDRNIIINFYGNTSFMNNTAGEDGGALYANGSTLNLPGTNSFVYNTASANGGALYTSASTTTFSGTNLFANNTASVNGGALYARVSTINLFENNSFVNNTAGNHGGAILASDALSTSDPTCLSISNETLFTDNRAGRAGGALYVSACTLVMSGNVSFTRNTAEEGGAISTVISEFNPGRQQLVGPLQANFTGNHANLTGGVMNIQQQFGQVRCYKSEGTCPLDVSSTNMDVNFEFINNSAGQAGTVLYGDLEACDVSSFYPGRNIFDFIRHVSNIVSNDNITSDIASDPTRVCSCKTGIVKCPLSSDYKDIKIVRGQQLTLMVVAVGQDNGVVPSEVTIHYNQSEVQLRDPLQREQRTRKECTPLSYNLLNINTKSVQISLSPDINSQCPSATTQDSVNVTFLLCPSGFVWDESDNRCVCDDRLQKFNAICNVSDCTIGKMSNSFWVGAHCNSGSYKGLIIHSDCPFDYCVANNVSFTSNDLDAQCNDSQPQMICGSCMGNVNGLDVQCNHDHSGTLCGSCRNGFSISLGTLHCLKCDNRYLALILPFALAGVGLVALLLLLNLSVASGTINGLIFYANIVQANLSTFFPVGMTNVLTVFIAWLNLDFGIEVCFYDGMTTYVYTWLQFVFPFYVWFLIGLIIVASRYSVKISKSLGTNPVAVLATLFLISYSKLLRNIIVGLSATQLELPNGSTRGVWLYDGNVPFFTRADHSILGIFSILVLVLLFLPYTFLFLFSPWLQRYSHWKMLSWLNKIKPFLDAYYAPYKKETRYWTGLLLLLRCILFLAFAFHTFNGSNLDIVFILSFTAGLFSLSWIHGGIYEKLHNNIIEASYLLNLIIFAAVTEYVENAGRTQSESDQLQAPVAYTSVGIALLTFIIILVYHSFMRLRGTTVGKKVTKRMMPLMPWWKKGGNNNATPDQGSINKAAAPTSVEVCLSPYNELRESLLTY